MNGYCCCGWIKTCRNILVLQMEILLIILCSQKLFARWTGSTAEYKIKTTNGNHVGVRVDTNSVGVLEGGGISGAGVGISAGNHSHVFETATNVESNDSDRIFKPVEARLPVLVLLDKECECIFVIM